MRFHEFRILVEGYKEALDDFSKETNPEEVKKLLNDYKLLTQQNRFQPPENNIDYWRKQGYDEFKHAVEITGRTPTKGAKIPGRSITLEENDQWLIVVPIDKAASCFHGKNTDWCTTKPHHSYFEQYFYDGEITLIYFLQKQTGNKWAIACAPKIEGQYEYFDINDTPLNQSTFNQQTGLESQKYIRMVMGNQHKPETDRSRADYRKYVEEAALLLSTPFTPTIIKKLERILTFTKNARQCHKFIVKYYEFNNDRQVDISEEITTAAFNAPDIIYNDLLDLIKNPSEGTQVAALVKLGDSEMFMNYDFSDRVVLRAVAQNPHLFVYVPKERKTPDLCLAAVQQNGSALFGVPEELKTKEMCDIAFEKSTLAFSSIPEKFITLDMCYKAVEYEDEDDSGQLIYVVPEKFMTYDFIIEAVKRNLECFYHIPRQFRTYNVSLECVKMSGNLLSGVMPEYKTFELCLAAVRQNPEVISWVPDELQDKIKAALKKEIK